MWLAIIGAPGSCKGAVAARLARDSGFLVEREVAPDHAAYQLDQAFDLQLEYLLRRYRLQRAIQRRAGEEDIVQVRTFWDTTFVYGSAAVARGYMKTPQLNQLYAIHATLEETLETPAGVVYLHSSTMLSGDRLALQGQPSCEEDRAMLVGAYAEFVTNLRVPVIDVEVTENFESVIEQVKAGLDSARAASAATVWKRSFMK